MTGATANPPTPPPSLQASCSHGRFPVLHPLCLLRGAWCQASGRCGCQEESREGPSAPHSTPPCPTAITSTLSLLNGSESTRLFAISRELLPGCIRCAVVGNGGILNGSRQGQNIDAHDYVFRYVGQGPGRKQERSWVESWSPARPPEGSIIGEGVG